MTPTKQLKSIVHGLGLALLLWNLPARADDLYIDEDPRLNRARAFMCENQANLARNYLSSLLKDHKDNIYVLNLRAFANIETQKYKEAIADCDVILRQSPLDAMALSRRAFAHCKVRNYEAGIKDLTALLAIMPDDTFSLQNRSQAFGMLKRHAEARADYEKGKLYSPLTEVRLARTKKEFEAAYKTINQMLLDSPNDGYLIAAEARCNLHLYKYAEAADLASGAIEMVPSLKTSLLYIRALALVRSDHCPQAISDLSTIIDSKVPIVDWEMKPFCKKNPENDMWLRKVTTLADAYVLRARAYMKLSKYEHAVEDTTSALALEKYNVSALETRASAYNALKRYTLALADYKEALKLTHGEPGLVSLHKQTLRNVQGIDNGRVQISISLAQTLREKGSYVEALETLAKLTEAESDIGVYKERIKSYIGLKRQKSAFKEAEKMIKKFPKDPLGYAMRGDLQYRLKNYQEAVDDYTTAIKIGGSPELLFSRANAYKQLGNIKAAESDRLTGKLMMKR